MAFRARLKQPGPDEGDCHSTFFRRCTLPSVRKVHEIDELRFSAILKKLLCRPSYGALVSHLAIWRRRSMEREELRRSLSSMPEEAIADLGLSRCQAKMEAVKPFWRA